MKRISFNNIFAIILFSFFVFFTFFDLNWGAPYYFHPDERNIASSVTQLDLRTNMNPHFFAYGSLPIYIVYFSGVVLNVVTDHFLNFQTVPFESAMVIGRFFSGILTLALVFLIYKTTVEISDKKSGIIAALFGTTSVAYFQFSHFGTFEIWLSFFSLFLTWLFIRYLKTDKNIFFISGCFLLGLLTALKLSSAVLVIIPILVITYKAFKKTKRLKALSVLKLIVTFIYLFILSYFLSAPFNFLDIKSFLGSMQYESSVATGALPVFYTGSFYNTIPIAFAFQKLLPFLINPLLTVIFIPTLIYIVKVLYTRRDIFLGVVAVSFLCLFISESILFVKWTRYIVPSVSYLYILIAVFITNIGKSVPKKLFNLFLVILFFINFLFAFSFIKTVRLAKDTRIAAVEFAKTNITENANINTEVYDLGITPFNSSFSNISLFNFYDLDNNPDQIHQLPEVLNNSNFLILPSQRIYKSRILNPSKFPIGNKFYADLFSGKSGFKKIYETPCDIFCKITYMNDPIFNVEETSNVFDRPTLFIFEKNNL